MNDTTSGIRDSPLETARFGLRVGRWSPAARDEMTGLPIDRFDDYDVVIVRRPAEWADSWTDLMQYPHHLPIHADTLVYWAWTDNDERLPESAVIARGHDSDDGVAGLVIEVFDDYQNHYAANPLLDRRAALDGYVEWATQTCRETGGYVTIADDTGLLGFGVIDWNSQPPDVRLAGLRVRARGLGRYRDLMVALMHESRSRGHGELRISTQVQNIAVQRTWSRLGWRPLRAFDTAHLVRAELLRRSARDDA